MPDRESPHREMQLFIDELRVVAKFVLADDGA